MSKFRKKPVVIDAEQWFPGTSVRGVCDGRCLPARYSGDYIKPHVHTIHNGGLSTVMIEAGDWIIPEPDGIHFYPCKPDIFAATYEPVRDAEGSAS